MLQHLTKLQRMDANGLMSDIPPPIAGTGQYALHIWN